MSHLFTLLAQSKLGEPEYIGDSIHPKDGLSLFIGDWGEWNWARFFVLFFAIVFFCFPIFGRYSIIGYLNIFLFPFRLNKMLDNMDDFYRKK
jgi:hypothetical protein